MAYYLALPRVDVRYSKPKCHHNAIYAIIGAYQRHEDAKCYKYHYYCNTVIMVSEYDPKDDLVYLHLFSDIERYCLFYAHVCVYIL